jgi:DNA-binding transcriptional ArsR family regulator
MTMTEDIDDIRKELADIREMKEQLKSEIKTLREERREIRKQRKKMIAKEKALRKAEVKRRGHQPPEPPEPPEPVRVPRIELNLDDMTDSLEDMMEGLGEQIEDSLKGLRGIEKSFRLPGVYVRRGKSKRRKKDREIENISPDRVAEVLNPLSSVERLRILEFLKTDAATFNEIEQHIGKTGSSLTHHLNPLLDAGYVLKGEVRGTYHATVQGILAYRLAKWLTSRVEKEQIKAKRKEPEIVMDFEDEDEEPIGDDTEL